MLSTQPLSPFIRGNAPLVILMTHPPYRGLIVCTNTPPLHSPHSDVTFKEREEVRARVYLLNRAVILFSARTRTHVRFCLKVKVHLEGVDIAVITLDPVN